MTVLDIVAAIGNLPAIDPVTPTAPPGADKVTLVLGWIFWIAGIAGVAGIIFVGIQMALANRQGHGAPEYLGKLGWVIGGLILVSAATGIATLFLGY